MNVGDVQEKLPITQRKVGILESQCGHTCECKNVLLEKEGKRTFSTVMFKGADFLRSGSGRSEFLKIGIFD